MHKYTTRSNKEAELLNLSNPELGKLERENRRAQKSADMLRRVIIRPDADGILRDQEGRRYNDNGDMVDDQGNVIQEEAPAVGHAAHNAAAGRQQVVPVRGRILADYNRPDEFYANRSAIQPPPIQRNDFELKPIYYQLVGQHPFHGLSHENPMDHLEKFEGLAYSMKYNGVSTDYICCTLFPHSLAGDASYWLRQLPAGSLTTWEDTKKAFLINFFDDAKSEELRAKIAGFSQGPTEGFRVSWMRFKAYQRDCPHHGFTEVQLLRLFYSGVDWRYQVALDSASAGNFNTRSPEEARTLIENLVSSNSAKNADFERKQLAESKGGAQSAELKNKLDSIHNLLVGKKQVHFAAEVESFGPEEEEVNFINGAGFQGQKFGNQQNYGSSFQKPFQSNNFSRSYGSSSYQPIPPKTSESRMESMMERILEGQQKQTVDFNGKLDAMYLDLNGKFEVLNNHVKKLDTQVAQTASAVQRQEGRLPGRTEDNPRQHVNAIMLGSAEKSVEDAEFVENFETTAIASIDAQPMHRSMQLENPGVSSFDGQKSIQLDATPSMQQSIDRHTFSSVGRRTTQTRPTTPEAANQVEESVYKPKIPYPKPRKSKQEIEEARCKAIMDKVLIEMPLVDAVKFLPSLKRYSKRMVSNGVCPEEAALLTKDICSILTKKTFSRRERRARMSEQVCASVQSKIPEKLPDPGSFVLDCSASAGRFPHSLCDLGSSINLMPRSVAERLGMTDFKPTRLHLILADRSKRFPEGVLEDVPLMIAGCQIPTDFVVLEYGEEPQDPLLLGRSFLATVGAIIDVRKGEIDLDLGDKTMTFNMDKLRRKATIDGQTFSVEVAEDGEPQVEVEHQIDTTAGCVKVTEAAEQVEVLCVQEGLVETSKQAAGPADWSGDQLYKARVDTGCSAMDNLPQDDVFVMEAQISELECRTRAETRVAELASIDATPRIGRCNPRHEPKLPNKSSLGDVSNPASPKAVLKQPTPPILPPPRPKKLRALVSFSNEPLRSRPPKAAPRPVATYHILGRKHGPNAYTPPWMLRSPTQRHSMSPSDPPDR